MKLQKFILILIIIFSSTFATSSLVHAKLWKVILEVPESLDTTDPTWQASHMGVVYELYRLDAQWPAIIALGTVPKTNKKIINSFVYMDGVDPLGTLQALLIAHGLDIEGWDVKGMLSVFNDPAVWDLTDPENPVLVTPAQPEVLMPLSLDILNYVVGRPISTGDNAGNITITGYADATTDQLANYVGHANYVWETP